jgi:hypothetical protein
VLAVAALPCLRRLLPSRLLHLAVLC